MKEETKELFLIRLRKWLDDFLFYDDEDDECDYDDEDDDTEDC